MFLWPELCWAPLDCTALCSLDRLANHPRLCWATSPALRNLLLQRRVNLMKYQTAGFVAATKGMKEKWLCAFSFQGLHWVIHAIGESFIQARVTLLDRVAGRIRLSKLHRRFSNCTFLHLNFSNTPKCIMLCVSSGKIWGKCVLIFGIKWLSVL